MALLEGAKRHVAGSFVAYHTAIMKRHGNAHCMKLTLQGNKQKQKVK